MQLKIIVRWALGVGVIAGVVFFSLSPFFLVPRLSAQGSYVAKSVVVDIKPSNSLKEQISPGLPVRLKIPTINLNVELEHVGITLRGALDVPKGRANAGWFKFGPRPGEEGVAIIDGHFGFWKNDVPAVFNNLNKLRKGDVLSVEDQKGKVVNFVVREVRRYDPKADTSEVFVSNDEKAHLTLITCDGVWNKFLKTYSKRLVVFTDREGEISPAL
ncbi:MAG: class F sortase [Patescibacteria group bacterium]|nr:class F sortase [Patescibacteria group bacterium]